MSEVITRHICQLWPFGVTNSLDEAKQLSLYIDRVHSKRMVISVSVASGLFILHIPGIGYKAQSELKPDGLQYAYCGGAYSLYTSSFSDSKSHISSYFCCKSHEHRPRTTPLH